MRFTGRVSAENYEFAQICKFPTSPLRPDGRADQAMGDKAPQAPAAEAGMTVPAGGSGPAGEASEAAKAPASRTRPQAWGRERIARTKSAAALFAQNGRWRLRNGCLFERYLDRPPHVEIQVRATPTGDCAPGRAPAPDRDATRRWWRKPEPRGDPGAPASMGAASVALASASDMSAPAPWRRLIGWGFLFMEITPGSRRASGHGDGHGVRSVKEQLAAGASCSASRGAQRPAGHSIECRVNEDAAQLPAQPRSSRRTTRLAVPELDTHVCRLHVPPHYDRCWPRSSCTGDWPEALRAGQRWTASF
jgi:biotin carboxylase